MLLATHAFSSYKPLKFQKATPFNNVLQKQDTLKLDRGQIVLDEYTEPHSEKKHDTSLPHELDFNYKFENEELQEDYKNSEDTRTAFNEFMKAITACHLARKRTNADYTYLDSAYKSTDQEEICQLMMAESYGYKFNGINVKTNVMTLV